MSATARERIDTRAIEERADLFELASLYTELDKSAAGPCPKCGGDDRFHLVRRGGRYALWTCRRCRTDRHEGPIGLVMWAESVPFLQAVARLTGEAPPLESTFPHRANRTPSRLVTPEQMAELGRVARLAVERIEREEGKSVRAALGSRGLSPATWRAFGIGASAKYGDAIALPYVGPNGVVGVRYRALTPLAPDKPGKKPRRYFSHEGSVIRGAAFGLPLLDPGRATALFVIEGELNAASVHQATRPDLATTEPAPDVMSPGSESADATAFRGVAALYDRVLVWADTEGKAARILAALDHPNAAAIASEAMGGRDANDVLQESPAALAGIVRDALPRRASGSGIVARNRCNSPTVTPESVASGCGVARSEPESVASGCTPRATVALSVGCESEAIASAADALLAALARSEWRFTRPDLVVIAEEARTLAREYRAAKDAGEGGEWRRSRAPRLAHLVDAIEGRTVYAPELVGEALAGEIRGAFLSGVLDLDAYYREVRELDLISSQNRAISG